MSLAEHLEPSATTGEPCKFARVIDELDDTDRATYNTWIAQRVALARITAALTRAGHPVSATSAYYHLAKTCRCYVGPA